MEYSQNVNDKNCEISFPRNSTEATILFDKLKGQFNDVPNMNDNKVSSTSTENEFESNTKCSICLEYLNKDEAIIIRTCFHV